MKSAAISIAIEEEASLSVAPLEKGYGRGRVKEEDVKRGGGKQRSDDDVIWRKGEADREQRICRADEAGEWRSMPHAAAWKAVPPPLRCCSRMLRGAPSSSEHPWHGDHRGLLSQRCIDPGELRAGKEEGIAGIPHSDLMTPPGEFMACNPR